MEMPETIEEYVDQALALLIQTVRKHRCFSPFAILFLSRDTVTGDPLPETIPQAVSVDTFLETLPSDEARAKLSSNFSDEFSFCKAIVQAMARRGSATAILFFTQGDLNLDVQKKGIVASFHHYRKPSRTWCAELINSDDMCTDFSEVEIRPQDDPAVGLLPLWN